MYALLWVNCVVGTNYPMVHTKRKTTQIVYEHNNLAQEALTEKRQQIAIVRAILYASKIKTEKHENIITRH